MRLHPSPHPGVVPVYPRVERNPHNSSLLWRSELKPVLVEERRRVPGDGVVGTSLLYYCTSIPSHPSSKVWSTTLVFSPPLRPQRESDWRRVIRRDLEVPLPTRDMEGRVDWRHNQIPVPRVSGLFSSVYICHTVKVFRSERAEVLHCKEYCQPPTPIPIPPLFCFFISNTGLFHLV